MAGETSIPWKVCYWLIVVCGILLILSSFFPGVKASSGSLQPIITHPAGVTVHEAVTGSQLTLTCEVSRTLPGGATLDGTIQLWWCNSTVDSTCYESVQSFSPNGTSFSRLWISYSLDNATLVAPVTLENLDEQASGSYFCVAYREGNTTTPSFVNVSLLIADASPPILEVTPTRTISAEVHKPLVLECRATGFPTPRYNWTKNGDLVLGSTQSRLVLEGRPEDNGTYICIAFNAHGAETSPESTVTFILDSVQAIPEPTSEPTGDPPSPSSSPAVITAIVIILLLIIATVVIVVWFCKFKRQPCIGGHKVKARHSSKTETFTSDGGINGFGMTPVQAEMQPFILRHRCDIFIHHHGTDLTLAEMMRSKLLDQESHLHVMLWSEVAGTGRESRPSTKRLALSLVHSTTVVLLISWKYLQHESQRFRLALSRIPRKVDTVKQKVVIVRRIEEEKVPQDIKTGVMNSLEYNVDTDSKFFWPRFNRAVVPQRDDMLYWRT